MYCLSGTKPKLNSTDFSNKNKECPIPHIRLDRAPRYQRGTCKTDLRNRSTHSGILVHMGNKQYSQQAYRRTREDTVSFRHMFACIHSPPRRSTRGIGLPSPRP